MRSKLSEESHNSAQRPFTGSGKIQDLSLQRAYSDQLLSSDLAAKSKLQLALEHAKHGWRVFPMHSTHGGECSCSRGGDCSSSGKHSRIKGWQNAATIDACVITGWWSRANWQDSNVGITMGSSSNVVVLNIDNKPDASGEQTLADLEAVFESVCPAYIVKTGRGWHMYFRHPGVDVRGSVGTLGPGLDLRADGSCVVAAGFSAQVGNNLSASRDA